MHEQIYKFFFLILKIDEAEDFAIGDKPHRLQRAFYDLANSN